MEDNFTQKLPENSAETPKSNKRKLNTWLPLMFSVLLAMGMLVGYTLKDTTINKISIIRGKDPNKVDRILNLINAKYVDEVDREKLITSAVNEMLTSLDPHSFYISHEELSEVNESLEGNFEGVGIEFYIVKDTIVVVTPISGGPSEALGIRSGDKIIKIEDSIVAGVNITNREIINKLRGQKGSEVKVSIMRSDSDELVEYSITRDKIPIFSVDVSYMVDDEVGYIKINRFSATTYEEFMNSMTLLQEQGMKKLILDLRQNPGGYLGAATLMADEFLEGRKLLVFTEGKAYKRFDYRAKNPGTFENGDLVILIDQGSASASEIVAGAVQDWDRGLIIGRRSFGKGLVQEQYDLNDGSALRLTVARYYTPSGRSIQKPYTNGVEEYNLEVMDRFNRGEFLHIDTTQMPDSLQFQTSGGRVVYGGGGILPDIFVPIDTTYNLEYYARLRSLVQQFAYNTYSTNPSQFSTFENVQQFNTQYLVNNDMFQEFLLQAEAEGITHNKQELSKIDDRLRKTIKAYIAKQIWKNEGFFYIINEFDDTFIIALKELKKGVNLATVQNP